MLSENEIHELVSDFGSRVNEGRTIKQIIADNDIPKLAGATVLEGKVSDSVFSDSLKTRDGVPIRLMFRGNRISTHDVNRGAIPFKDQVLAQNHDHMLNLVKDTLGSSQFDVEGLLLAFITRAGSSEVGVGKPACPIHIFFLFHYQSHP